MEEATVTSFNILSESTEIIHVVLVFVQLVGMLSIVFSPLYIQLDTTAVNITFQMQKKKKKNLFMWVQSSLHSRTTLTKE